MGLSSTSPTETETTVVAERVLDLAEVSERGEVAGESMNACQPRSLSLPPLLQNYPPLGDLSKMATWIHISSHFKSGYPALQTCTAQSNMVSCRATIATNFVLAEIPSISRNSSRDRRPKPSTHGRNSFLVTSACVIATSIPMMLILLWMDC